MIEAKLYILADTVAAIIFAAAFFGAYVYDRKLVPFRWWTGFHGLIALSLATTTIDPENTAVGFKIVTWAALFTAVIAAIGAMRQEGSLKSAPVPEIAASSVLFIITAFYLMAANPPHAVWALLAPIAALIVVAGAAWRVLSATDLKPIDWGTEAALIAGFVLIAGRSLWFASMSAAATANTTPAYGVSGAPADISASLPPAGPMISPEQPLFVSLITILVLLGIAVVAIMRAALNAIDSMRERSTTDALSGLLNRATFDERSRAATAPAKRSSLCVVMFDIDHFKQVNDTCGHPAGDKVIATLGSIIAEATNDRHIAGRIGGEEFAVVLPGSNIATTRLFAEAVRTRFAACDFGPEVPWTITLSGGVAELKDDEPLHALVARADQALYSAKRAGRDRVVSAALMRDETELQTQMA